MSNRRKENITFVFKLNSNTEQGKIQIKNPVLVEECSYLGNEWEDDNNYQYPACVKTSEPPCCQGPICKISERVLDECIIFTHDQDKALGNNIKLQNSWLSPYGEWRALIGKQTYTYSSRTDALKACRDNDFLRLCRDYEAASPLRNTCSGGWTEESAGWPMLERHMDCGDIGWNDFKAICLIGQISGIAGVVTIVLNKQKIFNGKVR